MVETTVSVEADFDATRASLEQILDHSPLETRLCVGRLAECLADASLRRRNDPAVVAAVTRERIAATRDLSGKTVDAIDALLVARSLETATEPERGRLLHAWLPYLAAAVRGA